MCGETIGNFRIRLFEGSCETGSNNEFIDSDGDPYPRGGMRRGRRDGIVVPNWVWNDDLDEDTATDKQIRSGGRSRTGKHTDGWSPT
jgi:hypothetical protein